MQISQNTLQPRRFCLCWLVFKMSCTSRCNERHLLRFFSTAQCQGGQIFFPLESKSAVMYDSTCNFDRITHKKCGTVTHNWSQQLERKMQVLLHNSDNLLKNSSSTFIFQTVVSPKVGFYDLKVAECDPVAYNIIGLCIKATKDSGWNQNPGFHMQFRRAWWHVSTILILFYK